MTEWRKQEAMSVPRIMAVYSVAKAAYHPRSSRGLPVFVPRTLVVETSLRSSPLHAYLNFESQFKIFTLLSLFLCILLLI